MRVVLGCTDGKEYTSDEITFDEDKKSLEEIGGEYQGYITSLEMVGYDRMTLKLPFNERDRYFNGRNIIWSSLVLTPGHEKALLTRALVAHKEEVKQKVEEASRRFDEALGLKPVPMDSEQAARRLGINFDHKKDNWQ